ncbi:MAG TPA: ATP-binding protein [Elusimicrobiota bacterium]|nr:ATP-binding protein [Elusimicrobiota bacterium]
MAALLNFGTNIWVYTQAPAGPLRRRFLWWNSWVGLWSLGLGVGYLLGDARQASVWYRIYSPIVIRFIAPLFLHFIIVLTETSEIPLHRWALRLAYSGAIAFAVMDASTNWLTAGAHRYYWGFYPQAGKFDRYYGPFFIAVVLFAFRVLNQSRHRATGYRRNQFSYVLAGAVVGFSSGLTNFLPVFGYAVYPVGNVLNSLYSLLVAYAILEYGLMDIHLVARQSLVYGLFTGALTAVYVSIVSAFDHVLGYYGINEKYLFYTAAVPATIVLAPAMKARIEPWIERVPFWKTYRFSEILRKFSESVLSLLDLSAVTQRVVDQMTGILGTDVGALYLQRRPGEALECAAHCGRKGPSSLEPNHPILNYVIRHHEELVKEKALWAPHSHKADADPQTLTALATWPYALSIPLFVDRRFLGLVTLGEKRTGNMFNQNDIQLLRELAAPAGVALLNALTISDQADKRQERQRQQELIAIGRMATEIAHELSKPLTHIVNEQSQLKRFVPDEVQMRLTKIGREAARVSDILESFAMLSPHQPLERSSVWMPDLLEEAIAATGVKDDTGIMVVRKSEQAAPAPVNYQQMLQVFENLIQNARESMPNGGTLHVTVRKATDQDRIEIAIADTGPGIPREIQGKIFDHFFTTKQGRGGRGMGLAISLAMVQRHGGTIRIESPLTSQGGTRVVVQLPLHEEAAV